MLDSPYRAPGQDFHLRSQRPCPAHLRPPSGRPPLRAHRVANPGANPLPTQSTTRSLAELPYHPHIQHEQVETTQMYIRPRAQRTSTRPHQTTGQQTRPLPAARRTPQVPGWTVTRPQSTRISSADSLERASEGPATACSLSWRYSATTAARLPRSFRSSSVSPARSSWRDCCVTPIPVTLRGRPLCTRSSDLAGADRVAASTAYTGHGDAAAALLQRGQQPRRQPDPRSGRRCSCDGGTNVPAMAVCSSRVRPAGASPCSVRREGRHGGLLTA
jgi:hypothetical protein